MPRLNEGRAVALHCGYCGDPVWENNGHLCKKCRKYEEELRSAERIRERNLKFSERALHFLLVRDAMADCPLSPGLPMSVVELHTMLKDGVLSPGSLICEGDSPKKVFRVRANPLPHKVLPHEVSDRMRRKAEVFRWLAPVKATR